MKVQYLIAAVLATTAIGCQQQSSPVNFSITVPQPDEIDFQATLTQHYGLGLEGSFALPNNVGSISLVAETPTTGFGISADIDTAAFLSSNWTGFQEVTALPTGAPFPNWITGPVLDVQIPALNQSGVQFHFYFGVSGQYYLGVAAVIDSIDGGFPAVTIGDTFYTSSNNVVLGFQFFGPSMASNGQVQVPGGIFIGTNLTPLLPTQPAPAPGPSGTALASSALSAQDYELKPLQRSGKSSSSDVETSGPAARSYSSTSAVQGLISRYAAASRSPE